MDVDYGKLNGLEDSVSSELYNALEYIKKLNELLTWDTMKTDVGVLHDLYTNLLVDLKNEIDSILNTTLDGNVNSLKSMESAIKNPGSN